MSDPETYHDVLQKSTMINDSCCVPFLHLFYGDKSFSSQHRGHSGPLRLSKLRHLMKQICNMLKKYLIYVCMYYMQIYVDMSLIYVSIAQCQFLLFAEILLNIHEDMRRNHWTPVAFMPIYDQEKSNRPTQGHKCDPVRAMRVYHDCCRHILGTWKDKTHNIRVVSLGNVSRHQVRSFLGRLVGDDAR